MANRLIVAFTAAVGLLLGGACGQQGEPESDWTADVPHTGDVGAANLPVEIVPVTAPFAMPAFEKPSFPTLSLSIVETGATEGEWSTAAIQTAIDDVSARGGGRVLVPAGTWRTGRLVLKSNIELHLEEGAELHFSADVADYRPAVFTRNEGIELMSLGACLYANGQSHIAVTGQGKLVGPGEGSVREQTMTHDVIENVVPLEKPVAERIYEGHDGGIIFPPMMISAINCSDVYIEGVTIENAAFWNVVPIYCDGVIIRGITVNSVGIARGDGIDVESSRNVLIEYCTLNTGDDCFTIKAGRGEDGLRVNRPSENIVVRYCLAKRGHGGITVGSETAGMVRNLYVHDCVFDGTGVGIRFKTRRPRGGGGEQLYYERIRMNLEHTALRWDMLGSAVHVGELATDEPLPVTPLTPRFSNVDMKHLIIEQAAEFIKVDGIPESPLTGVTIRGVKADTERLVRAKHMEQLVVQDAYLASQDTAMYFEDCQQIRFERTVFNISGKERPALQLTGHSTDIEVVN